MADRDWKIMFVSACALLVIAVAGSLIVFTKISNEGIPVTEEAGSDKENLNTNKLHDTVIYYQNKAIELEKIKNTKPSAIDPSI